MKKINIYVTCISGTSPNPISNSNSSCSIKQSCDRHLLAAAHNNIRVGPLLAVLKAIIVVGDATALRPNQSIKKSPSSQVSTPGGTSKMTSELSISHILGTSDILGSSADHLLMELGGYFNVILICLLVLIFKLFLV